MKVSGNIVDIHNRVIFPGVLEIEDGKIVSVVKTTGSYGHFIMPGLVDAHIHIESSMITPGAFASKAVSHGTVCVVSDPHEIANVLGLEGVEYMIDDSKKVPMKFYFGAPSCVPATDFENSGARLDSEEIEQLLRRDDIGYLSEMMNFPGVVYKDPGVLKKIEIAGKYGKPVDGHAPGLSGDLLKEYVSAGISTDHECSSIEEAREKIGLGMKVLIREGSAARNLDALKDLFWEAPEMIMMCSDDLHPEMLEKRHINKLIARLVSEGYDLFDVLRSCTGNPKSHYSLDIGLLLEGDNADFIIVDSPETMNVQETWINGMKVYSDGRTLFTYKPGVAINRFFATPIDAGNIRVEREKGKARIIEAFDGSLLTGSFLEDPGSSENVLFDPGSGINKIVVKDRYADHPPATGFIKGFSLSKGAIASSVAHDSHNIIAVGDNDEDIVRAVNEIIRNKGGIAVSRNGEIASLRLEIAGIMTTGNCSDTAALYLELSERVKDLGCSLSAPFMTLSFMALLVIPELKIGDRGLFDVGKFKAVSLFTGE